MSYIVTVDYTMKQRAISDGIRLNDTTLYSTIEEARRYSNFFLVLNKRKKAFEDKLYELLKEEARRYSWI